MIIPMIEDPPTMTDRGAVGARGNVLSVSRMTQQRPAVKRIAIRSHARASTKAPRPAVNRQYSFPPTKLVVFLTRMVSINMMPWVYKSEVPPWRHLEVDAARQNRGDRGGCAWLFPWNYSHQKNYAREFQRWTSYIPALLALTRIRRAKSLGTPVQC